MLFLVYWIHWESHVERNWFTISHHYHHEENNWFSHGIQILLEFQFGLALPVLNEFLFDNILDKWVIIFLYIFYSSVHNINYSMFHINKTHELRTKRKENRQVSQNHMKLLEMLEMLQLMEMCSCKII